MLYKEYLRNSASIKYLYYICNELKAACYVAQSVLERSSVLHDIAYSNNCQVSALGF